jgi:hypothetical protein
MLQISDASFAGGFQRVVRGKRAVVGAVIAAASVGPAVSPPLPSMVSRFVERPLGGSSLRTKIATLRLPGMPRLERRAQISHGKAQERLGAVRRRSQMMPS